MGKTFDKVGISLIAALLAFLFFVRLTGSIAVGATSAVLSVLILLMIPALFHPRTPRKLLSKRNFIRYILLNGNSALKELVQTSFASGPLLQEAEGHTVLSGDRRVLIYYAYKFGSLSEEDVAKSYRLAKKYDCPEIYALTNHLDRKALAVTEYIPQRFTVTSASALYKYLLKKSLIPPKESLEKRNGKISRFLKSALNEHNAKFYIWAGLSTALLAMFTPITTYYIVFSFLNLALSIACVLLSEKSEGKDRLFKN